MLRLLLLFLLCGVAAAQERFSNGNVVQDGRGGVFYSSGERARLNDGSFLYRNPGFGGLAFRQGLAQYPNGQAMRTADGTLFYANGQAARSNGVLFHQNGTVALDSSGSRYSNGASTGDQRLTLKEPFPGGAMVIVSRGGSTTAFLFLQLGEGWNLLVNLDNGEWEVSQ